MASNIEYVKYIADQLSGAGAIEFRRMFGEYGIYCDGKYFAAICDDRLLIKVTAAGEAVVPGCPRELPYEGAATPMFLIEDTDDRDLLVRLAAATCGELPPPKPKRIRSK